MSTKQSLIKCPCLYSYAYLRKMGVDRYESILKDPRREVIIDSGAFTVFNSKQPPIPVEEYIDWLKTWKKHVFGYFALDVLRNPKATDENLQIMLKHDLKPIPVHVFGDNEARMEELYQYSDWVAFGGMNRPKRGSASKEYIKAKMDWAKGRKVHWFGYSSTPTVRAFKPYSCDVSSWRVGFIYSKIYLYMGGGRFRGIGFKDWLDLYPNKEIEDRVRMYGIDPAMLKNKKKHWGSNRKDGSGDANFLIIHLSCRGFLHYSYEMRKKVGTRVFLASLPTDPPSMMDGAIEWAEKQGWNTI